MRGLELEAVGNVNDNLKLTAAGRALQDKAMGIPQCILGASGLELEQLRKLQADLVALRSNLQNAI